MRRSRRYVKYFWIAKGITFDIDDEFVWCKSMSSSEIDEPKDPHLCFFCRIPQNPPDGGIPQKYLEKILKSRNSEKHTVRLAAALWGWRHDSLRVCWFQLQLHVHEDLAY